VLRKDKDHHHTAPGHGQRFASGVAAILTLNNISYIRRELLLNSNVPDLLASGGTSRRDSSSTTATGAGPGASSSDMNIEDELNKRNRQAKTSYLEIFSPLVSCLMDAGVEQSALKSAIGVGNTEKKDTKDRFGRFNEALEEVESLHKMARLDKNEPNLRERVKDEVIRMCVPTYTRFVQKHENFSKSTCIRTMQSY
jgi:exocyst complex protein 7